MTAVAPFKVLLVSDWHLDALTGGYERFADLEQAVQRTVDHAVAEQVDLYCFLGDLADPDTTRVPRCVAFAVSVAKQLARARIPSRWLTGNHDVIEDGRGSHVLLPLAAAAREDDDYYLPMWTSAEVRVPFVRVFDAPWHEQVLQRDRRAGVNLVALPFTASARSYDPLREVAQMRDELPERIFGNPFPFLVLGHLHVRGVVPMEETRDMPRGREVWLPSHRELHEALRVPSHLLTVANGHYHRAQVHEGVVIPGSLERLTFGEEGQQKSFTVLEIPQPEAPHG